MPCVAALATPPRRTLTAAALDVAAPMTVALRGARTMLAAATGPALRAQATSPDALAYGRSSKCKCNVNVTAKKTVVHNLSPPNVISFLVNDAPRPLQFGMAGSALQRSKEQSASVHPLEQTHRPVFGRHSPWPAQSLGHFRAEQSSAPNRYFLKDNKETLKQCKRYIQSY